MVVNVKMEGKIKIVATVLVILLAVTLPIATVVVASYLLNSNHVTGTVNTVKLTLTVNNTNVEINDVLLLTAQLNNTKSGVSVQFFNGTTALNPTVNTDSFGKAVSYYNVTDSSAYDLHAVATYP